MIDRVVGEGNTALGLGDRGGEPPAFGGSLDAADLKDGWFMVNNITVLVFVVAVIIIVTIIAFIFITSIVIVNIEYLTAFYIV